MGLLDDAIKEHLELKRRRGADASEIAREEAEALGPVRREPEVESPAEPVAHEVAPPYEPEHEPPGLEDPGAAYDDPPEPEAHRYVVHEGDDPVPADPPHAHEQPYTEPEAESATPPHGDPLLHQQTREFSSEELDEALGQEEPEAPAPEGSGEPPAGEREDVLEETPDFLQETPEHDRLWFEQKPPKDFDF